MPQHDVKGECMLFHFRLRPIAAQENGSGDASPGDASPRDASRFQPALARVLFGFTPAALPAATP
jgi:hypothetical protein